MNNDNKLEILDIFSNKRLSKVEVMKSPAKTQSDLMKKKLKDLIEKLKNGQSSYNNILVMDTSGPQNEDLVH